MGRHCNIQAAVNCTNELFLFLIVRLFLEERPLKKSNSFKLSNFMIEFGDNNLRFHLITHPIFLESNGAWILLILDHLKELAVRDLPLQILVETIKLLSKDFVLLVAFCLSKGTHRPLASKQGFQIERTGGPVLGGWPLGSQLFENAGLVEPHTLGEEIDGINCSGSF